MSAQEGVYSLRCIGMVAGAFSFRSNAAIDGFCFSVAGIVDNGGARLVGARPVLLFIEARVAAKGRRCRCCHGSWFLRRSGCPLACFVFERRKATREADGDGDLPRKEARSTFVRTLKSSSAPSEEYHP